MAAVKLWEAKGAVGKASQAVMESGWTVPGGGQEGLLMVPGGKGWG